MARLTQKYLRTSPLGVSCHLKPYLSARHLSYLAGICLGRFEQKLIDINRHYSHNMS